MEEQSHKLIRQYPNGWAIWSVDAVFYAKYEGSMRRMGYDFEKLEDWVAQTTKSSGIAPRWRDRPQEYGAW